MLIQTNAPATATLHCPACHRSYPIDEINTYATCCDQPLVGDYSLSDTSKNIINTHEHSMWRYADLMPLFRKKFIVSLKEGMTPVVGLPALSARYGLGKMAMKDESVNPTGSFKARGISAAVTKAKEFNIGRCIIPTAGNAGGALAAYCAKAGIECTVVMPEKTPDVFKHECELYGANLVLVDGLINDCAKRAVELGQTKNYFDVSTMKEPFRLEGKKTMGYEIAEQYNWQLPDVIIYPAGGGTGLIGIWQAFKKMRQMGWVTNKLPRMIAVQAENCASISCAQEFPRNWKEVFKPKASIANGLAVPYPFAMDLMLGVLAASNGEVCNVSEAEIVAGVKDIASTEGRLISPEGAAAWKGLLKLRDVGKILPSENILILNTGSGYKYISNII